MRKASGSAVAYSIAYSIKGFIQENNISRFGIPKKIVSYNGAQFALQVLQQVGDLLSK